LVIGMVKRSQYRPDRSDLLRTFSILLGALLASLLLAACAPAKVPQDALKQYLQAEDFYVRGQVEAALAIFSKVARQNPQFSQARFMEGKSLYLLNKPKEAESVFVQLVRREPRYHEAQIWLARIEVQQGETEKAEKLLTELLGYDSQDERLLYLMGQVKTDQGKLQDAITYLEKAGATEEELARVHIDLGRLYYRFGLEDRAHKELTRVLLLLPPTSPLQKPVTDLLMRIKAKE
jgi:tetratricopeptide (TPR) repeat protein